MLLHHHTIPPILRDARAACRVGCRPARLVKGLPLTRNDSMPPRRIAARAINTARPRPEFTKSADLCALRPLLLAC